ncbi:hypothetical protein BDF22DRAFT_236373 [Syncephalis plumigaleata]|nr:hypothetical protein BDF22DRAFT_236373 [Syncephalis plumigaleata]
MHLTGIVTLLSTLGVAMAQQGTTTSTGGSISDVCKSTINGKDVLLSCFILFPGFVDKRTLSTMCPGPADGGPGHFCSTSQINSVLDLIEKNCKEELANGNTEAQLAYTLWLTYGLYPESYCVKSSSGAYCLDDPKSFASGKLNAQCDGCLRDVIQAQVDWTPDRSPELGGKSYESRMELIQKDAKVCNITPRKKGPKSPLDRTSSDTSEKKGSKSPMDPASDETNSSMSKWIHANWALNLSVYIALMTAATTL